MKKIITLFLLAFASVTQAQQTDTCVTYSAGSFGIVHACIGAYTGHIGVATANGLATLTFDSIPGLTVTEVQVKQSGAIMQVAAQHWTSTDNSPAPNHIGNSYFFPMFYEAYSNKAACVVNSIAYWGMTYSRLSGGSNYQAVVLGTKNGIVYSLTSPVFSIPVDTAQVSQTTFPGGTPGSGTSAITVITSIVLGAAAGATVTAKVKGKKN